MAAIADICNRALQNLGAKRLVALTDATPQARACNLAWDAIRRSELRKRVWNFAILRASLAADNPAPAWGRQNSFTLPPDFIRLADSYPELLTNDANVIGVTVAFTATYSGQKDWVIESGNKILTNDEAPLNVRYISDIKDTSQWDPLFCETVSYALAWALCEELTQSNTKKADILQAYKFTIDEAALANSIEVAPADPPPDTWLTVRS